MTSEFSFCIEKLYATFSKYPFNSVIEGCPCCVSGTDKATLHSKQLRELNDEDIARYAFKAITTWGSVNDFKYYLPRIFELASKRNLIVDTFVVIGKLETGKWKGWESEEIEIVVEFLKAWWKYDINYHTCFDPEILLEINKRVNNLESLLASWEVDVESQGFRNYVEFVEDFFYELKGRNNTFKELSEQELSVFCNWVEMNSPYLEEGYFKYENIDKKFSDRISNALYLLERIT